MAESVQCQVLPVFVLDCASVLSDVLVEVPSMLRVVVSPTDEDSSVPPVVELSPKDNVVDSTDRVVSEEDPLDAEEDIDPRELELSEEPVELLKVELPPDEDVDSSVAKVVVHPWVLLSEPLELEVSPPVLLSPDSVVLWEEPSVDVSRESVVDWEESAVEDRLSSVVLCAESVDVLLADCASVVPPEELPSDGEVDEPERVVPEELDWEEKSSTVVVASVLPSEFPDIVLLLPPADELLSEERPVEGIELRVVDSLEPDNVVPSLAELLPPEDELPSV